MPMALISKELSMLLPVDRTKRKQIRIPTTHCQVFKPPSNCRWITSLYSGDVIHPQLQLEGLGMRLVHVHTCINSMFGMFSSSSA